MLELKLDANTMFEWQRHSHSAADIPHYQELLDFVNLRAQAAEASSSDGPRRSLRSNNTGKRVSTPITSNTASADTNLATCIACKAERHPLFVCPRFKSLSHADKTSLLKSNSMCLNCLRPGQPVGRCTSVVYVRNLITHSFISSIKVEFPHLLRVIQHLFQFLPLLRCLAPRQLPFLLRMPRREFDPTFSS